MLDGVDLVIAVSPLITFGLAARQAGENQPVPLLNSFRRGLYKILLQHFQRQPTLTPEEQVGFRFVEESLVAGTPRTRVGGPGSVIPQPTGTLATTAAFPAGQSAQEPILPGSREDPFGFIRPGTRDIGFADGFGR